MIQSFACSETEAFYRDGVCTAGWQRCRNVAARKLDMIDAAVVLGDLRVPSGNRLEALSRDREGQWSIRINKQWRICFQWGAKGPEAVEIVDYH